MLTQYSLFLMVFSQFGFYDDNETVVEMQHQDVSEDHTTDTQTQHCFIFFTIIKYFDIIFT